MADQTIIGDGKGLDILSASAVRAALEELDLRPFGRTLIKPNVVASGPMFQHAYTRPEFVEGVIAGPRDRDGGPPQ